MLLTVDHFIELIRKKLLIVLQQICMNEAMISFESWVGAYWQSKIVIAIVLCGDTFVLKFLKLFDLLRIIIK